MLITILATVVVLGVLIFVHELGHFVTAKAVGIGVPRFSIGLGPKLVGFRRGETEYVISWLPLGGYVRMTGMDELEKLEGGKLEEPGSAALANATDVGLVAEEAGSDPQSRSFESKSLPARFLVISAGVLMNALFAVFLFAASALIWGVDTVPDARIVAVSAELLPPGTEALSGVQNARLLAIGDQSIRDWRDISNVLAMSQGGPTVFSFEGAPPVRVTIPADEEQRASLFAALQPLVEPVLGAVEPSSPAAAAGLRTGDRIVRAAGEPIATWQELVGVIQERPDQPIEITLERGGQAHELTVVPRAETLRLADGEERVIGRIGVATPREQPGPVGALVYGTQHTWEVTTVIVRFLGDLFTGNVSPRNLGGPILIGQISGQVARAGLQQFLNFMALFSINLAVLNLLPIPILDGGQLVFLGIEAVRGRALSIEARMRMTQVGLVIVVALMVWALASDLLRVFGL
jgi:regulator of sigma E protease